MYQEFSKVYDKFMEFADYDGWHDFVTFIINGNNLDGKNLLDLGCGTGEVMKRFITEYECTGVDLSEDMLLVAKEKFKSMGISGSFFCQDMTSFSLEKKYDIVISLFDTVNHLISLEDLVKLFERVKEHLNDGGIYIFDVVDRNFMEEMFPDGLFVDKREDMTVIWEHYQEDDLDFIETVFFLEENNGLYRKYTENYIKKIFTHKEIVESAKQSGLYIENIYEEGNLAGDRFFYALKK
jgi:cyclopropane fatty-acyl-phospholipid synthase-like methyltransferase